MHALTHDGVCLCCCTVFVWVCLVLLLKRAKVNSISCEMSVSMKEGDFSVWKVVGLLRERRLFCCVKTAVCGIVLLNPCD